MLLLADLNQALSQGAKSFEASSDYGHFHFRIVPSANYRLTTGGSDPLFSLLAQSIDKASHVDIAVAFVMDSGVRLLGSRFRDLLDRGGQLRIVLGDYLNVTEPSALWRLSDIDGAQVRVFEALNRSFHPKAWLFRAADQYGAAIVGSSNLSETALTTGVEWNLHTESAADIIATAFQELWTHPQTRSLSPEWIEAYSLRRSSRPLPELAEKLTADEPKLSVPVPHLIQQNALAALSRTRAQGYKAGLVVLATGLGKTWTAAFDSINFPRVLFVAHRDEILSQAMAAFRQVRPEARFGRFDGENKDNKAEVLFASIQTLSRARHLSRFSPDAFDYIIVDEFHHAAASTYRKLLDHFAPTFMLGLTATPDRSDGADLLALCGDNLVYQRDLFDGIEFGLLSPFKYFGVPDEVDYAQIPWRSNRFDPTELEAALVTKARASNALDNFMLYRKGPAIGFCVSVRHADYMVEFFKKNGLRAVAVHSGPTSAPRTTSLEQLGRAEIDILFAVDIFNEGVDVPQIGTVMMLRPTESVILWLQQLGRGLRRVEGKVLQVIDYIGNHRIFLTKLRALLSAGTTDRSLELKLSELLDGNLKLPPGCEITYDLKVIEIFRNLLRPRSDAEDMEAQYRDFRLRNGVRPTASEMARMGFDPSKSGHGSWFEYVRDMGDMPDDQVLITHGDFLKQAERCNARALPALRTVVSSNEATEEELASWAFDPMLRRVGRRLELTRRDSTAQIHDMLEELLDWRLAKHDELDEEQTPFQDQLVLWSEYLREAIPPFFGTEYNPGNWNVGIVRLPKDLVLLTTLKKENLSVGGHYDDRFLSPSRLQWQSQTQTQKNSYVGKILSGKEPSIKIHLFIRSTKLRHGKGAPFIYCGQPRFVSWDGEKPITVQWHLPEPVPVHLRKSLGVPDG